MARRYSKVNRSPALLPLATAYKVAMLVCALYIGLLAVSIVIANCTAPVGVKTAAVDRSNSNHRSSLEDRTYTMVHLVELDEGPCPRPRQKAGLSKKDAVKDGAAAHSGSAARSKAFAELPTSFYMVALSQVFGLLIGSGYMLNHKASSDTKADYTLPVMLLCIAAAVCYGRIAMSGVKIPRAIWAVTTSLSLIHKVVWRALLTTCLTWVLEQTVIAVMLNGFPVVGCCLWSGVALVASYATGAVGIAVWLAHGLQQTVPRASPQATELTSTSSHAHGELPVTTIFDNASAPRTRSPSSGSGTSSNSASSSGSPDSPLDEDGRSSRRPGIWAVRDAGTALTAWCLAVLKTLASKVSSFTTSSYTLAFDAVRDVSTTTTVRGLAVLTALISFAQRFTSTCSVPLSAVLSKPAMRSATPLCTAVLQAIAWAQSVTTRQCTAVLAAFINVAVRLIAASDTAVHRAFASAQRCCASWCRNQIKAICNTPLMLATSCYAEVHRAFAGCYNFASRWSMPSTAVCTNTVRMVISSIFKAMRSAVTPIALRCNTSWHRPKFQLNFRRLLNLTCFGFSAVSQAVGGSTVKDDSSWYLPVIDRFVRKAWSDSCSKKHSHTILMKLDSNLETLLEHISVPDSTCREIFAGLRLLDNIVNLDVEKTIQRRRQYLENTKFGYNLFVRVAVAIHHSPLSREIQERLTDVLPAGWKEEHLGQAQIHLRAFVRAAIAVHYCRMTNEGKAEFVAVLPAQHKDASEADVVQLLMCPCDGSDVLAAMPQVVKKNMFKGALRGICSN